MGLTLLHSERPKLIEVLAVLSAIGFNVNTLSLLGSDKMADKMCPEQNICLHDLLGIHSNKGNRDINWVLLFPDLN